jgi:hypothetical protein
LPSPGAAPLKGVPADFDVLAFVLLEPELLPQAATPSAMPAATNAGRRRRMCT